MFTSDNFNKYPEAEELLNAMIEKKLDTPFLVQCDTQVARQDDLIDLLGRAGCYQIFVGVESFNRNTLLAAKKAQNHPAVYGDIIKKCRERRIMSHFSNIICFLQDTRATIEEHINLIRQQSFSCQHAAGRCHPVLPAWEDGRQERNQDLWSHS